MSSDIIFKDCYGKEVIIGDVIIFNGNYVEIKDQRPSYGTFIGRHLCAPDNCDANIFVFGYYRDKYIKVDVDKAKAIKDSIKAEYNPIINLTNYPENGEHQEFIHKFSEFFRIVKGMDGSPLRKKWYIYYTAQAPNYLYRNAIEKGFNTPYNAYKSLLIQYSKYLKAEMKKCKVEKFGITLWD